MKHYLFEEVESGEEFIVGVEDLETAIRYAEDIAKTIGKYYNDGSYNLHYYGEISEEEAENSGLDEY